MFIEYTVLPICPPLTCTHMYFCQSSHNLCWLTHNIDATCKAEDHQCYCSSSWGRHKCLNQTLWQTIQHLAVNPQNVNVMVAVQRSHWTDNLIGSSETIKDWTTVRKYFSKWSWTLLTADQDNGKCMIIFGHAFKI